MGQANRRGTFEQRQAAAYERIDADIEVRKKEIEELDALEARQMAAMSNFVNNHVLPRLERAPDPVMSTLMRADYSLVELKTLKSV
jgi:hypothetical protein